jgi:hypothetical protein
VCADGREWRFYFQDIENVDFYANRVVMQGVTGYTSILLLHMDIAFSLKTASFKKLVQHIQYYVLAI